MEFDSPETTRSYSDRRVDSTWKEWCALHLAPQGKDVADIGCGGGIYSIGFAELGARTVVGVDQSSQYIEEATAAAKSFARVSFQVGSATKTGLPSSSVDIVFERALIHHLSERQKSDNAAEARRLLRRDGLLVIQDRTFDDVQSNDPACWIRATLFAAFPKLLDFERARRPARDAYENILARAGFIGARAISYREVRKRYGSFDELRAQILARKGKSILYELNDEELLIYCNRLGEQSQSRPLIECDLWTVWTVEK